MHAPQVSDSSPSQRDSSVRVVWNFLHELALLTPLLAIVWMTLISVINHQRLNIFSAHFKLFGLWDFVAVAFSAWLIGLISRWFGKYPRERSVKKSIIIVLALLVTAGLAWVLAYKVSQMVVLGGFSLCAGVLFYFGLTLLEGRFPMQQAMSIMTSTFFAAAAWMALRYEGQSAVGVLCRGWMALAFFAPAWLSMSKVPPSRPVLGLVRGILGGYLFAAGISLAPMTWGGEPQMLFAADSTLLVTLVAGLGAWLLRDLQGDEGPERDLMGKFIPFSLLMGFAASGLLWVKNEPNDRLLAASTGLSLLFIMLLHFASRKATARWARPLWFASMLSPIAILLIRQWFPALLS